MTADAASPDTPTDPVALVAEAIRRRNQRAWTHDDATQYRLEAEDAVRALAAAGLLSLSGDTTQHEGPADPDAVRLPTYTVLRADLIGKAAFRISGLTGAPALESPTREIAHQIADAVLPVDYVAELNAERGRLYRVDEGSLRSRASDSPAPELEAE